MKEVRAVIGKGGRTNIHAEHRRALGLKEGGAVLVGIREGERAIRIQTREASPAQARSMVRPDLSDDGTSMSEELLWEEARAEAEAGNRTGGARGQG